MNRHQLAMFGAQPTPEPAELNIPEHQHGTLTGYRYGCRCHQCKTAKRNHKQGHRTCHICKRQYNMRTTPGSGSKYCSLECKKVGYNPTNPNKHHAKHTTTCLTCGAQHECTTGSRYARWEICLPCYLRLVDLGAADSLAKHKAPAAIVHGLLNDPHCQTCRKPLGSWVTLQGRHGKKSRDLAIDHDHNCCDKDRSCGKCARGWLCRRCNWALGNAGDDPELLRAMADYIDKWKRQ